MENVDQERLHTCRHCKDTFVGSPVRTAYNYFVCSSCAVGLVPEEFLAAQPRLTKEEVNHQLHTPYCGKCGSPASSVKASCFVGIYSPSDSLVPTGRCDGELLVISDTREALINFNANGTAESVTVRCSRDHEWNTVLEAVAAPVEPSAKEDTNGVD